MTDSELYPITLWPLGYPVPSFAGRADMDGSGPLTLIHEVDLSILACRPLSLSVLGGRHTGYPARQAFKFGSCSMDLADMELGG